MNRESRPATPRDDYGVTDEPLFDMTLPASTKHEGTEHEAASADPTLPHPTMRSDGRQGDDHRVSPAQLELYSGPGRKTLAVDPPHSPKPSRSIRPTGRAAVQGPDGHRVSMDLAIQEPKPDGAGPVHDSGAATDYAEARRNLRTGARSLPWAPGYGYPTASGE